jgi:hypothetical protein
MYTLLHGQLRTYRAPLGYIFMGAVLFNGNVEPVGGSGSVLVLTPALLTT